jgi:hypothetical protein
LQARLEEACRVARENLRLADHQVRRHFRHSPRLPEVKVGAQVMLYSPMVPRGRTPKFWVKWKGPYVVTEVLSQWLMRVQLERRKVVVHRNRVWPCQIRS